MQWIFLLFERQWVENEGRIRRSSRKGLTGRCVHVGVGVGVAGC